MEGWKTGQWLERFLFDSSTRCFGTARIYCCVILLNTYDLAARVHDKGHPVGHSVLWDQDAVLRGNLKRVIAQHRIGCMDFFPPVVQRGACIGADRQDLCVHSVELCNTSLVC